MMSRGSLAVPCATASMAPMPCSSMSSRPRTVTPRLRACGNLGRGFGHLRGVYDVGGLVDEVAGDEHALREETALGYAPLELLEALRVALDNGELLDVLAGVVVAALGAVVGELVEPEDRPFGGRLRGGRRVESAHARAVGDRRGPPRANRLEPARHGA